MLLSTYEISNLYKTTQTIMFVYTYKQINVIFFDQVGDLFIFNVKCENIEENQAFSKQRLD